MVCMSSHGSYDAIRPVLDIHAMINGFVVEAVQDVPEARMVEQPCSIVNHPAWTLSHLNAYSGMLLAILDDASVSNPDAEMERFGYGSTPVSDHGAYATKRELLDRFRERNARLAEVVAAKHSGYFHKPPPERFLPTPTVGHLAITLLVAHPAHHLGQLKQWRRAAGMAGKA